MEKDIFSIVEVAKELLHQYGLSDTTIRTYQERSFNQVIRHYQESGNSRFRLDFMQNLLFHAEIRKR